jgi:uncharacterized membrane protein
MNIVLWIIAGVLAAAFLAAGAMKLAQPRAKLIESGMGWAADFSDTQVKLIGLLEVLGAIGLIVPAALDIVPVLTPLAATGLFLAMLGAVVVHLRRGENSGAVPALVLGLLALFVAIMRFGPQSF